MEDEKEPKKRAGQPTKLTEEVIKLAENYCFLGATDVEMADFLGVCVATIYSWKNTSPKFLEATTRGKESSNARVASSLYTRACGYDKDGKHYPADPSSISLWLRNRDPEQWRDVKERIDTVKYADDEVDSIDLARRIAHILSEGLEKAHTTH